MLPTYSLCTETKNGNVELLSHDRSMRCRVTNYRSAYLAQAAVDTAPFPRIEGAAASSCASHERASCPRTSAVHPLVPGSQLQCEFQLPVLTGPDAMLLTCEKIQKNNSELLQESVLIEATSNATIKYLVVDVVGCGFLEGMYAPPDGNAGACAGN